MMRPLKYDEFKNALLDGIRNAAPAEYRHYSIEIYKINKDNKILDGICMLDKAAEKAASPVVYANEFYNDYIVLEDMTPIVNTAASILFENFPTTDKMGLENAEDNIVPVLINRERNKEKLKHLLHIPFLDVEIVFRWVMKKDSQGILGSLVTNEVAKAFSISPDTLLTKAKENMKRILPITVKPLYELIKDVDPDADKDSSVPTFVISNKYSIEGAAYILHDEVLKTLRDIFGRDYYILLASVHEALIIPEGFLPESEIRNVIKRINDDNSVEDVLSDSVYKYNNTLSKLK